MQHKMFYIKNSCMNTITNLSNDCFVNYYHSTVTCNWNAVFVLYRVKRFNVVLGRSKKKTLS